MVALRAVTGSERAFYPRFPEAHRLQDVAAVADQFRPSPGPVFEGGYEEYRRQLGNLRAAVRNVNCRAARTTIAFPKS